MTRRWLRCALLPAILAAVSSCSYAWRYVVVNNTMLPMTLEYRLRPDSADACPQCQVGYHVPTPRWITVDSTTSSGYCWKRADFTEYTVLLDGRDLRFQVSVPPAGMVEIYEHTSLDDYRKIPFRLVAVEATAGEHQVSSEGEALKPLFRKQKYWYALRIAPS